MRPEIERWLLQSKEELDTARVSFQGKKWFASLLRDLTKEYYLSRYPDATEDVPYKTYTKEDAEHYLIICDKIIPWVESQLQK